nr:DUF6233 domain-containing protein [Streptomyces sp. A0592]
MSSPPTPTTCQPCLRTSAITRDQRFRRCRRARRVAEVAGSHSTQGHDEDTVWSVTYASKQSGSTPAGRGASWATVRRQLHWPSPVPRPPLRSVSTGAGRSRRGAPPFAPDDTAHPSPWPGPPGGLPYSLLPEAADSCRRFLPRPRPPGYFGLGHEQEAWPASTRDRRGPRDRRRAGPAPTDAGAAAVVDRVRHPGVRRTPERVHTGDCPMGSRGRPVTAQNVRELLLTASGVMACPLCRPDSELGLLDT